MVQATTKRKHLSRVGAGARPSTIGCLGRWSGELLRFLHLVAEAKVRDEPQEFRDLLKRARMKRWSSLLACTAARALAPSLSERRCAPGGDGVAPSTSEVVRDHRHGLKSRGVRCARTVLRFLTLFYPEAPSPPPKKKVLGRCSGLVADFGQSNLGQSVFAQSIFAQSIFVLFCWSGVGVVILDPPVPPCGPQCSGPPLRTTAQNFHSPASIFVLFLSFCHIFHSFFPLVVFLMARP